ncbi:PLP-dependent aminotransferase family protein [Coralloluteibacterium stylophorae]|uniref:PLP-dependent aminotransferase family protein n=1 Tax=Coralloluteibacterium stylophorae TaxID=1776034 RepID=A0A8J7VTR7_9GAMM|nr:PLP-dependent aminotransferase family protein [Coralloluteibacterium stylophorae]MBS7456012.1 PLP-dependent aminotransferase family protein [Coralloluteibacterium stylophorae]
MAVGGPRPLSIDRQSPVPLAEQIRRSIAAGIEHGTLQPHSRLPSWKDLAAQLGVSRGTVQRAYEQLIDARMIVSAGAGGTRVAGRAPPRPSPDTLPAPLAGQPFSGAAVDRPLVFQMGLPSGSAFPAPLLSRLRRKAVRRACETLAAAPDPTGEAELRARIAAHVAIVRDIQCAPEQVLVTSGFSGGLGLVLHVLGLAGKAVWTEEPGFPRSRRALALAGARPVPVPVDADGMDVGDGIARHPDAAAALVTAGQQAPLGMPMSPERRHALLAWAATRGAFVIEDDYLSELQLEGRAAPALASLDRHGRVIHIGSFSKTLSPTLRLGFVVAPPALRMALAEAAAMLAPAPGQALQWALAEFMAQGHYLRHLRRTKRLYAERSQTVLACLEQRGHRVQASGLAVLLSLPADADDVELALRARAHGLAPAPLSPWYAGASLRRGLLLNVATLDELSVAEACDRLCAVLDRRGRD